MPARVLGGRVVKQRMKLIARNVHREMGVRIDQNALDLLGRARGLAPQLDADLILSGDVVRRGNQSVHKRVVFFDSPYAVRRHEDRYKLGPVSSVKQSPDGPIGRKYLSRPLKRQQRHYIKHLKEGVKLALRQSLR